MPQIQKLEIITCSDGHHFWCPVCKEDRDKPLRVFYKGETLAVCEVCFLDENSLDKMDEVENVVEEDLEGLAD